MGENLNEVFSALGEKIRSLKTDLYLKDLEIERLKAEKAELQRRVAELEEPLRPIPAIAPAEN